MIQGEANSVKSRSNPMKFNTRNFPAFSREPNMPSIEQGIEAVKLSPKASECQLGRNEEFNLDGSANVAPRERLKRHREDVAGRVTIPERWEKEDLLKDWMDCSSFDALLAPKGVVSARASLVREGRRSPSQRLRIESRC
ncbi:hypothetical protein HS088_TW07G00452 [Tripterygium wilfordii]|uniref:Protein BIC1 n=2 Tax=Tripterygium wilfordii TaxID=458696 RepID=A0A7J7DEZ1_TRIWF|nr:hypothetical protein HS088_TW07G00452 [Tripterygium wilfordii]